MEIFLADAGTAVHNHRNSSGLAAHAFHYGEVQTRFGQVDAMGRAERARQRVYAGLLHKILRLNRIRINLRIVFASVSCAGFVFAHAAQLRFHAGPFGFRHRHSLLRVLHILLIRKSGTVVHNGGKSHIQAFFHVFHRLAVIQVYAHGNLGIPCELHHQRPHNLHRVVDLMALRELDHHRQSHLFCRRSHGLQAFQIRRVESAHRDLFFFRHLQDLF